MAQPRGTTKQVTTSSTAEVELLSLESTSHSKRGIVAYLHSASVAGTMSLFYKDATNTDRLLKTAAVAANDLTVINVDFRLPSAVLKFTPSASTSSVVNAEIIGF
jgi:hypothetical protein